MTLSRKNVKWIPILKEMASRIFDTVHTLIKEKEKFTDDDFKKLLDIEAQKVILHILETKKIPSYLVSEEGDQVFEGGGYYIVADPIDGTTNMARGLYPAVTSIAVSESPTSVDIISCIIKNLYNGDVYIAEKDKGATLNGVNISTDTYRPIRDALLSMDISKKPNLEITSPIITTSRHIRQLGCSAMSLCNVANGVLDAHIDVRGILRNTDIAAGLVILKEAGGCYSINDEIMGVMPLNKISHMDLIAASNIKLLHEIIEIKGNLT
jgi:myo-inositol-1(or 4)-monophosphatase